MMCIAFLVSVMEDDDLSSLTAVYYAENCLPSCSGGKVATMRVLCGARTRETVLQYPTFQVVV